MNFKTTNLKSLYPESDKYRAFICKEEANSIKWFEVDFTNLSNDTISINYEFMKDFVIRLKDCNYFDVDVSSIDDAHYFLSYLKSESLYLPPEHHLAKLGNKMQVIYNNCATFKKPLLKGPFDKLKLLSIANKIIANSSKLSLDQALKNNKVKKYNELDYIYKIQYLYNRQYVSDLKSYLSYLKDNYNWKNILTLNMADINNTLDCKKVSDILLYFYYLFSTLCQEFKSNYEIKYECKLNFDNALQDMYNDLDLKLFGNNYIYEWEVLKSKLKYWSDFFANLDNISSFCSQNSFKTIPCN